jgi:Acetyltransferase (GNAT) family.
VKDVGELARGNIVSTYLGLVSQLPGARIERRHGFTLAVSDGEVSFGNFAAGFERRDAPAGIVADLVRVARSRRRLWAFLGSEDGPPGLCAAIQQAGFERKQSLVQMVAEGPPKTPGVELDPCLTLPERAEAARFMCGQFFSDAPSRNRRAVEWATALSPHRLQVTRSRGAVVGSLMLTEEAGCDGLYNLCVHRGWRGRGLGAAIVRTALTLAHRRGVPLVLQCDEHLAPWYEHQGFRKFGRLDAFSWIGR